MSIFSGMKLNGIKDEIIIAFPLGLAAIRLSDPEVLSRCKEKAQAQDKLEAYEETILFIVKTQLNGVAEKISQLSEKEKDQLRKILGKELRKRGTEGLTNLVAMSAMILLGNASIDNYGYVLPEEKRAVDADEMLKIYDFIRNEKTANLGKLYSL
jgi:hypothetical protein